MNYEIVFSFKNCGYYFYDEKNFCGGKIQENLLFMDATVPE